MENNSGINRDREMKPTGSETRKAEGQEPVRQAAESIDAESSAGRSDAALRARISLFRREVSALRRGYSACLPQGRFPEALRAKERQLKQEENSLLTEALPLARRYFLNRRDPEVKVQTLITAHDGGSLAGEITADQISEAGLPPETRALVSTLLETEPGDPDIPEAEGFSEDDWPCGFYLSAGDSRFRFVFGDDGTVLLLENNLGWQCRRTPLAGEIFAENAVCESSHSVLVLDVEHNICRISYARLENAAQLADIPRFPQTQTPQA